MVHAATTAERIVSISFASPDEIVDLGDDPTVVHTLHNERILGHAVHAVSQGAAIGSATVIDALDARHEEVMRQSMQIEVAGLEVAQALSSLGIEYRVLKGMALAHTAYPDPSLRSFRDVDVLVRSNQIDRAVAQLLAMGAVRLQPELREGYDARFAKSVTFRLDRVEIDLHRVLSPGPFGVWSAPSELFLLPRQYEVAGQTLDTLDPTDHLVHACYHVALGQVTPVLANLFDVAALATSESNDIDFDRFTETITRWRGAAVIKRAVRLVEARIEVELPEAMEAYRYQPVSRRELDMIAPYLTEDPAGRFAALAPSTLKALPLADRAAFALAVGLPAGSDPKERARSLVGRVRQMRSR